MNKYDIIKSILSDNTIEFNLAKYSYQERLAYVSMIISLAWADGSIDDREMQIIDEIAKNTGNDIYNDIENIITQNQKFEINKYDEWVKNVNDQPMKIALLIDMFLTAFADTTYMQSETLYMKYIAEKLKIDVNTYNKIKTYAEQIIANNNTNSDNLQNNEESPSETDETESVFRKVVNSIIKTIII